MTWDGETSTTLKPRPDENSSCSHNKFCLDTSFKMKRRTTNEKRPDENSSCSHKFCLDKSFKMKHGTTNQKLFSFEESRGAMRNCEQFSETCQAQNNREQPEMRERCDTMHGPIIVVANSKPVQTRPRRIVHSLSMLACIAPGLSGDHDRTEETADPIPLCSRRGHCKDDGGCPENGDCSAHAASVTLKSSDPSEEISVRPLFMRRRWCSTGSISSLRGSNVSDKWYIVRNEEPDNYDGVMHAVFYDTYKSEE